MTTVRKINASDLRLTLVALRARSINPSLIRMLAMHPARPDHPDR